MIWEITLHEEVNRWYLDICKNDPEAADKIEEALDELAQRGPSMGRPLVDRIHHSRVLHNLKELRPRVPGEAEIRMLFVFDPSREAVVLVAGDKSGEWNRWYRTAIPLAEQRYLRYQEAKAHEEES
ncbi:type II toxin-antitoxin system RelE/ParE family toxin [Herbidospora mongoliensis]|uniref:type II toxin-antitoxin system RelE/ParE family toxin n=1 Tax=Herbidospora mongoliensis TaxID=688067 RepID=UPI000831BA5B|nr:type II toxin-antitoxin system RelE/ParE family toxin [Herbidospora mongoliensis]